MADVEYADAVLDNDDAWLQVVFENAGEVVIVHQDESQCSLTLGMASTRLASQMETVRKVCDDRHINSANPTTGMISVVRRTMTLLHAACTSRLPEAEARTVYEDARNALCPLSAATGSFQLPEWVRARNVKLVATLEQPNLAVFLRRALIRLLLQPKQLEPLRDDELAWIRRLPSHDNPHDTSKRALLKEVNCTVEKMLQSVIKARNEWQLAAVFVWATVCAAERMTPLAGSCSYPSLEQRQDASLALLLPAWWAKRTAPEPSEATAEQVCVVTYGKSHRQQPSVASMPIMGGNASALDAEYGWLMAPNNALAVRGLNSYFHLLAAALSPALPTSPDGFAEWALLPQWLPPHAVADTLGTHVIGVQPPIWFTVLRDTSMNMMWRDELARAHRGAGLRRDVSIDVFPWVPKAVRCLGLTCDNITEASLAAALTRHRHPVTDDDDDDDNNDDEDGDEDGGGTPVRTTDEITCPIVVKPVTTAAGKWTSVHVDLCLSNALQQVCGSLGLLHGPAVDRMDRRAQLHELRSSDVVQREHRSWQYFVAEDGSHLAGSVYEVNLRARVAETRGDLVETVLRRPDGTLLRTPALRIAMCRLVAAYANEQPASPPPSRPRTRQAGVPALQLFQQLAVIMASCSDLDFRADVLRYL